jgi:hypothetical protein
MRSRKNDWIDESDNESPSSRSSQMDIEEDYFFINNNDRPSTNESENLPLDQSLPEYNEDFGDYLGPLSSPIFE